MKCPEDESGAVDKKDVARFKEIFGHSSPSSVNSERRQQNDPSRTGQQLLWRSARPNHSTMTARLRCDAYFQRKATPAIGAVDLEVVTHVKKYSRVTKYTITIAANVSPLNFNDFNWLHSRSSPRHLVTTRITLGWATVESLDLPEGPTDDTVSAQPIKPRNKQQKL